MRVILYARVSTDEQVRSGYSLEAQLAKLRKWAEVFEHEVAAEIEDAGESGKSLNRDGIQQALALLSTGQADGLVIAKLDRLTRNLGDWQTLIRDYFGERAGKQLLSLADSIDTSTPAGRLCLNMLMSVAQWEREEIANRTRTALQYKLANNRRAGEVRYGWTLLEDGETLVRHESEQEIIELILNLRPMSYRKIANELNRRGIPSKKRNGWSHSVVASIVNKAAEDSRRRELQIA